MLFLRNTVLGAALLVLGAGLAQAQDRAVVLIDTNMPEAILYADSTRLGPASLGTFLVPTTTQRLRLVPPGGDAWSIAPVEAALDAAPGDTLAVPLPFPYHYQIETIPFGATAVLEHLDGRIDLGKTPVLYKAPDVLEGRFIIEHQGYLSEELTPGNEVWNRYLVTLQPLRVGEVVSAEQAWRPPPKRHRWIDYTAGAIAVIAGAVSIHHKFKADRLNDQYQQTGDPVLRPRINTLDTRAAVSLGVMQVGLGVLALRFILK